ncbi:hypothetical protein V6N13_090042 [Hibiscus sabdariffa]|uniref:Uncharacterized protein n=1 Tax=Hibiscus sabdariffa TaxID=183260 RepID=A0ABR2QI15_9ROSI
MEHEIVNHQQQVEEHFPTHLRSSNDHGVRLSRRLPLHGRPYFQALCNRQQHGRFSYSQQHRSPRKIFYQHVLRARNSMADLLAKRGIHSDFDMHIVSTPDATLRQLMLSDIDAHAGRVE